MSQRSEKLHRRVSRLEEQVQFVQNSVDFENIFQAIQQEREARYDRILHTARKTAREAERAARMWRALAWVSVLVALVVLFLEIQSRADAAEVEPVKEAVVQYDPPPEPMPEVDVSEMESATPRYALTVSERDIVERVVMAEAEGEGFDGQRLVSQCILNTAEAMDLRPDEVVLAPNQYATPAQEASQEVKDAVSAVFDDGNMVTDEPIQWFYAPRYVSSAWHESKAFVLEYGGHRFFKEG